jgi:antirestriction protein ArdC
MTLAERLDPLTLARHVADTAAAFGIAALPADAIEDGAAIPILQVVIIKPVTDEASYAVALHEIGHVRAPLGALPQEKARATSRAQAARIALIEEDAAWTWAEHHALDWTPTMAHVRVITEGTYRQGLIDAQQQDAEEAARAAARALDEARRRRQQVEAVAAFDKQIHWHSDR